MISKIRTNWIRINLVLQHRWEKGNTYAAFRLKKNYELGVWFKTSQSVGVKKDLVRLYNFGINFIVGKMWIEVSRPILEFHVPDTDVVISDNFQIGPHGAYEHEND